MGIAFFTCLLLAVSGYWAFTDKTVGTCVCDELPLLFILNQFLTVFCRQYPKQFSFRQYSH